MTTSKHTPGPWEAYPVCRDRDGKPHMSVRIKGDHACRWICHPVASESGYSWTREQANANANFIAAAPDMYETLIHVLGCIENGDGDMEKFVRAAIAKAEGRTK